ncbi:hypothetical protein EDF62_3332 [Leucobacter luti]|uniref:DUF7455 domain-containing protein n=1 Tax=Leucobacter luti TaxID=340320 RepID=A0A4R6RRU2_9MICO|nr:hypothetical protein [Leucobacter luti]TDP89579.1 hypothetical protein EDF62_3332 [Leucobacter luti]
MPTTDSKTSEVQSTERQLTLSDRCDACGAAAYVHATLSSTGLDLMFCGHHANRVEANLLPQSSRWVDDRHLLTDGPA